MRRINVILMLCVMVCWPSLGRTQDQTVEPKGVELSERFGTNFRLNHDRGLYFRGTFGVGYFDSGITPGEQGQAESEDSGARVQYNTVLGGYPTEQVVFGVHQWGSLGSARGMLSGGLGGTFYFEEDENLFVSVSFGVQTLYDEAPDIVLFEQWQASSHLEVGTGWWVTNHMVMGLSFLAGASSFDLDQDDIQASSWHVGLGLHLSVN